MKILHSWVIVIKKCFRYPVQDLFVLLAFSIALFFVLDFSYDGEKLRAHKAAYHPYPAQVTYAYSGIMIGDGPNKDEWVGALEEIDDGAVLVHLDTLKNGYVEETPVSVLVKQNGVPFRFPLKRGRAFEDCCAKDNAVILGSNRFRETQWENGKEYVTIGGVRLEVAAYLEDYSDEGNDLRTIILWETLTPEVRSLYKGAIDCSRTTVYFNAEDYSSLVFNVGKQLEKAYMDANCENHRKQYGEALSPAEGSRLFEVLPKEESSFSQNETEWYEGYLKITVPFSLFFSLCIYWHALSVWVEKRRHEYAIRRAFGYSKIKLALRAVREIAVPAMFSVTTVALLILGLIHRDFFRFISFIGIVKSLALTTAVLLLGAVLRLFIGAPTSRIHYE